jgi:hypothetical protein
MHDKENEMRATYKVPFADFDGYEKMAKACGATCAYHEGHRLVVTGTQEAIDKLSGDLDFGPDIIEGSDFNPDNLAGYHPGQSIAERQRRGAI